MASAKKIRIPRPPLYTTIQLLENLVYDEKKRSAVYGCRRSKGQKNNPTQK